MIEGTNSLTPHMMKFKVTLIVSQVLLATGLFAQIPNIKWSYYTGAPVFGSAAAADLDKDGKYEIVFTTYTNDGKLHCLNAESGTPRWVYDIGGCGDVAPLIIDVDNDDTLDVIANGSCNPTLFCVNGNTGQLKWSVPSGGGDSPPTAHDMDNDGTLEILFGNFNGQLRIVNAENGTTDKIIQVDPNGYAVQTEPTLVDCNGDGRLDIIMANHWNINGLFVYAFDYVTEDTLWTDATYDTSATYNAYHGGAVADIDGNGDMEYVIGSNNGLVRAFNVQDGSILWTRIILKSCMSGISIADLSGDGDLEVVVCNNDWVTLDERIWVLNGATGATEWSYATTFSSFRGCAIGDINGNGTLDLVAGYYMGDVIAVEPYTGLIWQLNLQNQFPAGLPYYVTDNAPLLADFDQNGTMDVFIAAGYGTYTPDSLNTGKAFLIEAGSGQCPEWLMFRQDIERSGYLSPADIQQSCSQVLAVNENAISEGVISIYPNPATDRIQISGAENGLISVYALNGTLLYNQLNQSKSIEIDISFLASGIYLIEVSTADGIERQKLIKQ
jgi:outer membrane protein assembly factor BamB